ncbi:MAG: UDP-N-acetylmuramyl peptide synthase, partial [Clostridia bacterium]|nr:UDP-N-acetylmuramyl peptide synthase [Clostridia bacterium]
MRLSELLREAGLPPLPGTDPEINDIADDSRRVTQGSLFVAVRGLHHDGHAYLAEAVRRGAAAVLIAEDWRGEVPSVPVARAADTRAALAY